MLVYIIFIIITLQKKKIQNFHSLTCWSILLLTVLLLLFLLMLSSYVYFSDRSKVNSFGSINRKKSSNCILPSLSVSKRLNTSSSSNWVYPK